MGVKRHEAEHFSIQQLLHPTPVNRKRHHEAITSFEGFSQKLQRLSTEPSPNIPHEEEEEVEEIPEDTAGTVILATHLVMEQLKTKVPQAIEKLIAKKTKAVEKSYEAQLQQLRTKSAALQVKLVQKDTQLAEYETTLKSAKEKYDSKMEAMSLTLANIQKKPRRITGIT